MKRLLVCEILGTQSAKPLANCVLLCTTCPMWVETSGTTAKRFEKKSTTSCRAVAAVSVPGNVPSTRWQSVGISVASTTRSRGYAGFDKRLRRLLNSTRFHLDEQDMPQRRDNHQVQLPKVLMALVHGRPRQVVKNVEVSGEAVAQDL